MRALQDVDHRPVFERIERLNRTAQVDRHIKDSIRGTQAMHIRHGTPIYAKFTQFGSYGQRFPIRRYSALPRTHGQNNTDRGYPLPAPTKITSYNVHVSAPPLLRVPDLFTTPVYSRHRGADRLITSDIKNQ